MLCAVRDESAPPEHWDAERKRALQILEEGGVVTA